MRKPNIQINDKRKVPNIKKLVDLIYGECFIYKEQLYINMGYSGSADLNLIYSLYFCSTDYLPSETKVIPVKIEINIIE